MSTTIWTDRSRIETYQRCNRLRWLEYHEGPDHTGISPAKKPLPLCVGGAVHKGLERLLIASQGHPLLEISQWLPFIEDAAVTDALADFATHKSALALDLAESTSMTPAADSFDAQIVAQAQELGLSETDPQVAELFDRQRNAAAEFDAWLFDEQSALVEGMVRAYSRRRLRPLLEEFEVLEVEREGNWELAAWKHSKWNEDRSDNWEPWEIRFMSRPDALLRSRSDNSLYILSYKTAATWDVRKARDAEHDMQGLSEGVEVERRLGEWWTDIRQRGDTGKFDGGDIGCSKAMYEYLEALPAPPRILGIRYEYMLKGYRSLDKDLSARFGINVWSQRSHLIQRYVATSTPSRGVASYSVGDQCWSYDYIKDDGSTSKLAWQNWRRQPVWENGDVKSWIDALDDSQMAMSAFDSTVGQEPRELGWKSAAQALGFTATHPLDDVFPSPLTVYRSDDQLRDWVDQVEHQEVRVAEGVAAVAGAEDEGERRHLLNVHFPMSRRACSYPTECACTKICYGGDDIQRDPLASGLYKIRVANHAQERESAAKVAAEARNG